VSKGRPREFDLNKAVDRALDVFRREGYTGASVAELTDAMGINPPSLYAAFGNKEGLFRKALERYVEQRTEFWNKAINAPTARTMIEQLLHESASFLTEEHEAPGCLLVKGSLSCSEATNAIQRELKSRRAAGEVAIRKRLERARKDGELPADINPTDFARYVATVLEGMAVQATGGATYRDLMRVAKTALRAWPA
jgi:AcrR family transcriptional regulator